MGATLTSLIRNCSNSAELKLWVLCSELNDKDKNNIRQLLQNESFKGSVEFINFNAKQTFGHLRSLNGDWTTYGRLLIPDVIKADIALYLDCDLIINADVLELNISTTDKILSAVYGCTVDWALEKSFFINLLKWETNKPYFNAGVLLFNILRWKADNTEQKVKQISAKYPNEFLSADQTLLNAVCEGNFNHLPKKFNLEWTPSNIQPLDFDKSIIHFVGSPKPWDLFGKKIHGGYELWKSYHTPFWNNQYSKITVGKLKRTWEIRRSIIRHLKKKLKKIRNSHNADIENNKFSKHVNN